MGGLALACQSRWDLSLQTDPRWRVGYRDAMRYVAVMTEAHSPEFLRGWDAAIAAARAWHEAKAKQTLVAARRSRFPKNLEREADVHVQSAELLATLGPDDV